MTLVKNPYKVLDNFYHNQPLGIMSMSRYLLHYRLDNNQFVFNLLGSDPTTINRPSIDRLESNE